jgi:hypothetical protein
MRKLLNFINHFIETNVIIRTLKPIVSIAIFIASMYLIGVSLTKLFSSFSYDVFAFVLVLISLPLFVGMYITNRH